MKNQYFGDVNDYKKYGLLRVLTNRGSRRRGSSKYVYWRELKEAFKAGHSLLIYQHFPRVKRIPFIEQRSRELVEQLNSCEVHAYKTSHVVFFLAPQVKYIEYFRERLSDVNIQWEEQIIGKIYQGV